MFSAINPSLTKYQIIKKIIHNQHDDIFSHINDETDDQVFNNHNPAKMNDEEMNDDEMNDNHERGREVNGKIYSVRYVISYYTIKTGSKKIKKKKEILLYLFMKIVILKLLYQKVCF